MRERVEDRDEPVDGVEGEGRNGGDVTGGEEGGLKEKEEEEGGAELAEGEGAVGRRGWEVGRDSSEWFGG